MTGAMDALVAEYVGIRRDLDIAMETERLHEDAVRIADRARAQAITARTAVEERLIETKNAIEAIQRRDDVADEVVAKLIAP